MTFKIDGAMPHLPLKAWAFLAAGISALAIGRLSGTPAFTLVGVAACLVFVLAGIWQITDRDPPVRRDSMSVDTMAKASDRLADIDAILLSFTRQAGIKQLRAARFANLGVYYLPWSHRVKVSREVCALMNDQDLALILAHEVGHAERRRHLFFGSAAQEEFFADRRALELTGLGLRDWRLAMASFTRIEGLDAPDYQEREAALLFRLSRDSTPQIPT